MALQIVGFLLAAGLHISVQATYEQTHEMLLQYHSLRLHVSAEAGFDCAFCVD